MTEPTPNEVEPGRLVPGSVASGRGEQPDAATEPYPPTVEGGMQAISCGCHPVGINEISELLGVKRATVDMWRFRGLLPEPRWTVSGSPAWDRETVLEWAKRTGRAT